MNKTELNIYELEKLSDTAEYIISSAWYNFPNYDENGDFIAVFSSVEDRHTWMENWLSQAETHTLCFRYNQTLRELSFSDALEMSLSEVKEKYLKDHLTKLRNMFRKDSLDLGYLVSADIPDSYLDDLLALRWKENLKLWTIQWKAAD